MIPKKKNHLFFIISLILYFNIIPFISNEQIILPFKTDPIIIDSSKYIEAITYNKIYITLDIGEPAQKINLYLTMDTSLLLIADSSINDSYYNIGKSNTYLKIGKIDQSYFEYYSKANYANDSFLLPTSYDNSSKKKFNNIQFIHIIEYSDKKYLSSGYFGLQLPKKNKKINIFENLNSYIFNLKYTSDSEGYLSIGGEFNKNEEGLKRAKALPCINDNDVYNNLCWYLKFNDIKFGDIKVNRQRDALIAPELGFIRGSNEYWQKIEENYFDKILKGKCTQKLSDNHYYYYECEKNTDLSSFKDLVFVHQDLMYNFSLTKDDLFITYGDKIYFLIVFDKFLTSEEFWKLGKPFIKKYNFTYDIDTKQIYFYYHNFDNHNFDEQKNNKKSGSQNYIILLVIIGVLCLGVIIMIALVATKIFLKPKKKKANELKDDFDYINEDSKNKNNNNQDFFGIS